MSGGPQPHMIPIVPGDPGLTGRTPLAERVERHMADKEDPHGTMVMVNEAIRGFIKNEADPLFSDWLAKHNVVEVETDPVFTAWVNRSNVRLGEGSSATSTTATALGYNAKCSADGSVQLGNGTNLTRTSLQFRNANLFVQGSGSVAALGTGFPRASASAYGAVKIGDGLKVADGVVSSDAQPNVIETVKVDGVPLHVSDDKSVDIRSTGMISDSAGNVIRADGSAVVKGRSSWTCNGVVLMKQEGKDNWRNVEKQWVLTHIKNSLWRFAIAGDGGGSASTTAPADATSLSFVIGGVTYEATTGRDDSVVMAASVIPMGDGTETIATVAGKDIKAPASPVSSVNGKMGEVKLGAQDVGALPLTGGTLTGDLVIGDKERPASRKLTVEAAGGANGITLTGGNVNSGSSMTIGGSSGNGGALVVEDGGSGNASIKKGGKEVATEEQLTPISSQSAYPISDVADGALKDRTVNHATAGGTFTFPERTGSNARDFVLVIDALETAPTVTFPGSVTYVSEQDAADIWTAEAGKVNAWYFSEVADGVFMVCHKAMGAVAQ